MAQRRMFSPEIVESEEFLSMPVSSQALYFHLAMLADDDGFVQPKKIMRTVGSTEDDLKVLLAKRFLLAFETGVVVVKHWLIHNMIRLDRYKPTRFQDEKSTLFIKENKAYSDRSPLGLHSGNQPAPQVRLGKVRKENTNTAAGAAEKKEKFSQLGAEVLKAFEAIDPKNKSYYSNTTQRAACDFLIKEYGFEEVKKRISFLPQSNKMPYFPSITTPHQLKDKWVQLQDRVAKMKIETGKRKILL